MLVWFTATKNKDRLTPKNAPGRASLRVVDQRGRPPRATRMAFHGIAAASRRQNAIAAPGAPDYLTTLDETEKHTTAIATARSPRWRARSMPA
jgi:hypothetical protein